MIDGFTASARRFLLVAKNETVSGSDLRLTARVARREFLGSSIRYGLKAGEEDIFIDVPHVGKRNDCLADDIVAVQISLSDVSIFR